MPYVDINPNRQRPKWQAYAGLVLLAAATICVVIAAISL